jgi:hypothetical protein
VWRPSLTADCTHRNCTRRNWSAFTRLAFNDATTERLATEANPNSNSDLLIFMLLLQCVFLQLIHPPNYVLNKIHSEASIKLLHVSAPECHHQGFILNKEYKASMLIYELCRACSIQRENDWKLIPGTAYFKTLNLQHCNFMITLCILEI